jgi:hypothetical protein
MIAYIAYILITGCVAIWVGLSLYKNGIHFLRQLFDYETADSLNTLLLTGYYLLNLGYIFYAASTWPTLVYWYEILEELANRTGSIFFILGCIHFGNLGWLALLSRLKNANSNLFH